MNTIGIPKTSFIYFFFNSSTEYYYYVYELCCFLFIVIRWYLGIIVMRNYESYSPNVICLSKMYEHNIILI